MAKSEIETVIQWCAEDDHATVCSMMPKIWRWCERCGGIEIKLLEGIVKGKKVIRTFLVDPACVRIKPVRKVSEATRQRLAAQGTSLQLRKRQKRGTPEGGTDAA